MRVAVIGAGIAGLYAAWRLSRAHDVTVFEANDYAGGHTRTVDVEIRGHTYAVDTGFIVFNDWTYRNFIALLDELGLASQPSNMSFSLQCERTGLEYKRSGPPGRMRCWSFRCVSSSTFSSATAFSVSTAQRRHREINGTGSTHYYGAYWRYGFHEDGVVSAIDAISHFEADIARRDQASGAEQQHLQRVS